MLAEIDVPAVVNEHFDTHIHVAGVDVVGVFLVWYFLQNHPVEIIYKINIDCVKLA